MKISLVDLANTTIEGTAEELAELLMLIGKREAAIRSNLGSIIETLRKENHDLRYQLEKDIPIVEAIQSASNEFQFAGDPLVTVSLPPEAPKP